MKTIMITALAFILAGCPEENGGGNTSAAKEEIKECKATLALYDESEEELSEEEIEEIVECEELVEKEEKQEKQEKKEKSEKKSVVSEVSEDEETVTTETTSSTTDSANPVVAAPAVVLTDSTLSLSESSHSFGSKLLNTISEKVITLTNSGDKAATSLAFGGLANPFTVNSSDCGEALAGNSSCDITISYSPEANGDHTDTLNITYNGGTPGLALTSTQQSMDLSLSGDVSPSISSISPSAGIGGQTLTINGDNFSANTTVKIGSVDCPVATQSMLSLTCTIPNQAAGAQTVSVTDGSKSATYNSFTYQNPASISVDNNSHSYDDVRVDVAEAQSFTLTNNGDVAATSLSFSGLSGAFSKTGGSCGTTLNAGSTCTVELTFTPTSILDNQTDEFYIDYHTGIAAASQLTINLGGDGVDRIIKVRAGENNTYIMWHSGKVEGVGSGYNGRIGNGNTTNQHYYNWEELTSIANAKDIATGGEGACAILSDDSVSCWGRYKNSGDNTIYYSPDATGETATKIAYGNRKVVLIDNNNAGRGLGENSNGGLGDNGDDNDRTSFVDIDNTGTGNIEIIDIAAFSHTIALDNNGNVYVAGGNASKTVGTDSTGATYNSLTQISGLSNITQIGAGQLFGVALDSSGRVYVWGEGSYGVTARTSNTDTATPILALTGATKISVGNNHIIALMSDKTVRVWGLGQQGQLGNGSDDLYNYVPQNPGLSNIVDIAAGGFHSMFLAENGDLYGTGNAMMLGAGYTNVDPNILTPVHVNP